MNHSSPHLPGIAGLESMIADAEDFATPTQDQVPAVAVSGIPAMSSLEIARITGKEHRNVLRDIQVTLKQAEIDPLKFEHISQDAYGRDQKCYLLPRRECDLVVSGYSVKYRLAIIDRWHELEAGQSRPDFAAALSDPSVLRSLLLDNVEKVLRLETAVSNLTPKAEALDRLAEADGCLNITNSAKALQIQPKKLFAYLSMNGWIYRRNGSDEWVPYQSRIQQGHMVAKVHTITSETTGEQILKERALVTPSGLSLLATRLHTPAT